MSNFDVSCSGIMSFVALPTTFVRLHVRMPSPLLHSKSLLPHLTSVATDEVWSAVRAFCFGQQNARRIVASQGVGHKFRQFALPGCRQNPSSPVEASRTPAFSVWFSLHLMTSHPAHREHGHGDRWLAAGRLRLFTQPKTTGRGKQNIYKNTSCLFHCPERFLKQVIPSRKGSRRLVKVSDSRTRSR